MSEKKFNIVNPLTKLTDEQKKLIDELRKKVDGWDFVTEKERKNTDDMTLFRFLSGWKWNFEDAEKALKESIIYRQETRPDELSIKSVEKVARTGYLFQHGFTREGLPVVNYIMGKDTLPNDEEGIRLKYLNVVYMMEKCIRRMSPGVYQTCWLVDMENSSLTASTIKQVVGMFTKMGDHYCERLGKCIVVNYAWYLYPVWKVISTFMAKQTVEKYVLIRGSKEEVLKELEKYIDRDNILEHFGGDSKYVFDYETELKAEEEERKREAEKNKEETEEKIEEKKE